MARDYQPRQGDGLWYWATIDKFVLLFDQVIIYSLMTSKKRNISSSKCAIDIKFDRVVVFDMGPTLNKSNLS